MKVAIKNKTEWKYIEAADLEIDGKKFSEVYNELELAKKAFNELIAQLQNKFIVSKDTPYIIQVGDTLKKVDKLVAFEADGLDKPLQFYKVEDGKIVLDNKKVGAI